MLPQADIQQYGGKAAILNHVREKLPHIYIPPYFIDPSTAGLRDIPDKFEDMKKPVIVRSSSPSEYGDFEGIFDSIEGIVTSHDFKIARAKVRQSATSQRAKAYATQNGLDLDDKIHLLVQEQHDSKYKGAMMRHPNNPDLIFIGYYEGSGKYGREHHRIEFSEIPGKPVSLNNFRHADVPESTALNLIDIYRQIETLKDIAEGYSLFVEFGLEPFALFQVRPFKRIETADFKLPNIKGSHLRTDLCFGITPQEGVVLPVSKGVSTYDAKLFAVAAASGKFASVNELGPGEFSLVNSINSMGAAAESAGLDISKEIAKILKGHNLANDKNINGPYCFITTAAQRENYDLDLSVPNAKVIVAGDTKNFLTHELIRLIKKGEVFVGFDVNLLGGNPEFYRNLTSVDDKVRIISNGKEAVVVKE